MALELPAGERAAYLDRECAGDAALRQRVEELLQANEVSCDWLEDLAAVRPGSGGTVRLSLVPAEKPGDRIGRYKLLQQIGEGGCGVVYMAEQEEPVRRRVALKVIKLGMDTKSVIARFEAERQALALMDHPNIAKVLEAGATENGRPYFVMELVRGIKITDYCDQNNLSTAARLELFVLVCQAIQHAHQKGIIHRDIKPSNILVTVNDGVPVPKVIDFGIAKATQGRLTDHTLFTAFEQFLGTPAYMSPEQAVMTSLDIDTRSDIYSLGVLLYELLAGSTPFDAKELMSGGLDAMRKIIREQEPVRPSTRFATLQGGELTTTAKRRSTDTSKLLHQLRGDLDWIVMKCLEKDRSRRYETANGLAMDIQRHMANEPVVARPPRNLYRFQKLVRRNKLAFAAAVGISTVLMLGVVVSTLEAIRARRAEREQIQLRQQAQADEQRARTEAAKATAISDFLQQSLQSANPDELKGSVYTVRQQLDDFSAGLDNQFQDQPEVEAAVRATLGRAYYRLGLADKAQPQMERALALRRRIPGGDEQVAETLVDYAWTSFEQGQNARSEAQAREALDIYRKLGAVGQPVLSALWALQKNLAAEGRVADVEAVTQEASIIAHKSAGVEFPELASLIHGLAELRNQQSRYAEAEVLARQAVAIDLRLRGGGGVQSAWAMLALGSALRGEQKFDEAERTFREALTIFRKQYTSGHKSVDEATSALKDLLEAKGDSAGLVALEQNTLADERSALGEDSPAVATTLSSLASHLQSQGKPAEAEKALNESLDITRRLIGQDFAGLPALLRQMSQTLKAFDKVPQAEKLFEDAINAGRLKLGETNLIVGELLYDYGDFLSSEGKRQEAVEYFLRSLTIRRARQNDKLCLTLRLLGDDLNQIGRYKEAEGYLRESVTLYRRLHQEEDYGGTGWANEKLGYALWQQHNLPEAEKAYRDALSAYTKLGAVSSDDFAAQVRSLHDVLLAENKPAEIETLYREVLAIQRSAPGKDSSAVVGTLFDLADFLKSQNRPEEPAQQYREAVDVIFKTPGEDPLKLPSIVQQLSQKLVDLGRPSDAEALYEDTISIARQNWGNSHPALGLLYYGFSNLLRDENKLEAAARQCLNALQIQNTTKDDALAATLRTMGWLQLHTGKPKEAEQSLREALEIYRTLPPQEDYRKTAYPCLNLGIALFDQRNLPEAERSFREAVALISQHRATNEDYYIYSACWLAMALEAENKLTESESLLHDASSQEGDAAVAAQLIENASSLATGIWPDEAGKWLLYSSDILDKAPAEDVAKQSQVVSMLVEAGYERQATNLCRRMLNSPSTNDGWFNGVAWYFATTENPSNRDPALAVELAKRAVKINPAGDWNTVGVAYYRLGDFKQALPDLERGNDGNSWAFFFLAMAHRQLGNADAARQYYDQAIQWMNEHEPQNPELLRFRAEAERLFDPGARARAETQIPVPPSAK